ncbi:MAG: lipase family alpha/beta hydrolase [Candidatus Odinarchaeota archaeon]
MTVLIHGFTNAPDDFGNWFQVLRREGFNVQTVPFKRDDTVYKSIEVFAKVLDKQIKNIDKKVSLNLIGFSRGGLVLRYYLQNLYSGERKINVVITVATPHAGTNLATLGHVAASVGNFLLKLVNVNALEPAAKTTLPQMSALLSDFLGKLNTESAREIYRSIPLLNIWLSKDGVIVPASNALFPFPEGCNYEIRENITHSMVLEPPGTRTILEEVIIPVLRNETVIPRKGPQSIEEWKERQALIN